MFVHTYYCHCHCFWYSVLEIVVEYGISSFGLFWLIGCSYILVGRIALVLLNVYRTSVCLCLSIACTHIPQHQCSYLIQSRVIYSVTLSLITLSVLHFAPRSPASAFCARLLASVQIINSPYSFGITCTSPSTRNV